MGLAVLGASTAGAHDGLEAVGVVLAQQAGHRGVAEARLAAADAAHHRQAVEVHGGAQHTVEALRVHACTKTDLKVVRNNRKGLDKEFPTRKSISVWMQDFLPDQKVLPRRSQPPDSSGGSSHTAHRTLVSRQANASKA